MLTIELWILNCSSPNCLLLNTTMKALIHVFEVCDFLSAGHGEFTGFSSEDSLKQFQNAFDSALQAKPTPTPGMHFLCYRLTARE